MMPRAPHLPDFASRREFIARAGGGFGALALSYLLALDAADAAPRPAAGQPPRRAKSVIWLFMEGGPSHLDLFDPKPLLQQLAGQPMPASFGRPITAMGTAA